MHLWLADSGETLVVVVVVGVCDDVEVWQTAALEEGGSNKIKGTFWWQLYE